MEQFGRITGGVILCMILLGFALVAILVLGLLLDMVIDVWSDLL